MEPSLTGLRVLREIAERGSFTAAATELGYPQSAVSRQVAALERATGVRLFERGPGGVTLTAPGLALLRHAAVALDAPAAADRELKGLAAERSLVRLGAFPSAGTLVVPRTVAALRRSQPGIRVTTREGSTPALVRALRARTLDLAVLALRPPYRPLDDQAPPLECETLLETELLLAVAAEGPLGDRAVVDVAELAGQEWIAGSANPAEPARGVWPGLPGRPRVTRTARDWLTKLHLVAAGNGVTTVPPGPAGAVPPGVRLVKVGGGQAERRRVVLARLPGPRPRALAQVAEALHREAARIAG
ncbi:LysR family transcriptional regulator [Streptomyces tremellae]